VSGVELTKTERFVLEELLRRDLARGSVGEAIVSSRASEAFGRWFYVNRRVAKSLHRKGLVCKGVERRMVRLSAAGRAAATPQTSKDGEG